MKKIFSITLLFFLAFTVSAQSAASSDKTPPKEAKTILNLTFFAYGADAFLSKADPVQIIVRGINKGNDTPYPTTYLGIKLTSNLTYYLTLSIIDETNPASKVYVGLKKKQFGEFEKESMVKKQKTRIYPENNIYTETLTLEDGIVLTIENKKYISAIYIPGNEVFYLNQYEYKNKEE